MATDPNTEPYEKDKPNPVDLLTDLSPLAALAYTHHVVLACGEVWATFAEFVQQNTDEPEPWIAEMPQAIARIADGWSEILETAGANWLTATGEVNDETTDDSAVGPA